MNIRAVRYSFYFFITLFFAGAGSAEQSDTVNSELQSLRQQVKELQQQMKDSNERNSAEIKMLKEEIELLKQKNVPVAAPVPSQEIKPVEPAKTAQPLAESYAIKPISTALSFQSFNPDISAIGDVLFHAGKTPNGETRDTANAKEKSREFTFRELELDFSSPVDPYGRADFFLSFGQQNNGEFTTDLEEGYFTFTTLPYDLQAKVGKFYSAFGKANTIHLHALPWVDLPNVNRKFFGEEPLGDTGAEVSWLVPNPWDHYIQLTQDVQTNGNEASFGGSEAHDLMYVTHLKDFFDLNKDSSLELGGSFATGANNNSADFHTQTNVEGLDITYKWKPYGEGLYKSVTWMNELLLSQKEQDAGDTVNAHGLYSSLEYQFNRRWSVFGRYDYTQFPDNSSLHENGFSTGLTFHQSEFMFWRLQFEHTEGENFAGNVNRNELLLQWDFLIGLHPAHQY